MSLQVFKVAKKKKKNLVKLKTLIVLGWPTLEIFKVNLHFCNYTNIKIPCLIYFGIKHFLGNYFSSNSLKVGEATLETFKVNLCFGNYTNIKISCLIYFKIKYFSVKYLSFVVFALVEKLGQA